MPSPTALNLIIPMVGRGSRFREGGFKEYKPFIPIQGRPMVEYVVDAFPEDVHRIVITAPDLLRPEQERFLRDTLNCQIHYVSPHKDGPAYSIYQASNDLPLEEAFFVAYCDIFWTWNFEDVRSNLDADGMVFTHEGFHPHLIDNSFSAFCRPETSAPGLMAEIREKQPFTDDWMDEPLSVGAFYFKRGHIMMKAISDMIEENERVAGEFFPSLAFNRLVADRLTVALQPVDFFIHWGVPEQLADFEHWSRVMRQLEASRGGRLPVTERQGNVVCMAGLGTRVSGISEKPKALIHVAGRPMYEFVSDFFPARERVILTTEKIAKEIDSQSKPLAESQCFLISHQTSSQFETLWESRQALINRQDFFLTACDAYGLFDADAFSDFIERTLPEAVVFTFSPSLTQSKRAPNHTHVSIDGDRITAVHVKSRPDDTCPGLTGFFWIGDGKMFSSLSDVPQPDGQEVLVDDIFKHWVETDGHIAAYPVDDYVHLGTEEELNEFFFWLGHKGVFKWERDGVPL